MDQPWISFQTSGIATLLAFIIAVFAARIRVGLSRGSGIALDALFLLPLLIPSAVTVYLFRNLGIFMVLMFGADHWINGLIDLKLHGIAAISVIYFCALFGFRKTSPALKEAARMQGLGSCGIFWRIEVPLAWRWLLIGLLIGFLRAFGESIFLWHPWVVR